MNRPTNFGWLGWLGCLGRRLVPSAFLVTVTVSVAVAAIAAIAAGGCTLSGTADDPGGVDASATGSGGSIGTSSGVTRSIHLMELAPEQAATLCDWANQKQGGYGRSTTCPSGTIESTNSSNLSCVNNTSALGGRCVNLTVANIEDCANATGTDLCKLENAPECVAVATCSM